MWLSPVAVPTSCVRRPTPLYPEMSQTPLFGVDADGLAKMVRPGGHDQT